MKNDFKMDMRDIKILQNSFHNIIKRTNELNKEWMKKMNKEQKIQELNNEIDKLKKKLEQLQDKSYEISYPDNGTEVYFINDYYGDIAEREYDAFDKNYKHLYDTGLYFDTEEEAEQFKREQTLIKKIKCWSREQQGDWQPDWNNTNQRKYCVDVDRLNKKTICDWCWGHDKLSKLPYFKSHEIAQACIDEFGDEILEVFC